METLHTYFFGIAIIVGRRIMLLLRLRQGIFRVPPCYPYTKKFLELSLLWERGIILSLRLSQGISSGCHHATPKPKNFSLSEMSLLWEGGIMLLLRLSQGISSGCHHATPKRKIFFGIVIIVGRVLCFCFDLAKVFLQDAAMPPLHQKILFFNSLWEVSIMLPLDLAKVFLLGTTMPPLQQQMFLELSLLWEGHYASAST